MRTNGLGARRSALGTATALTVLGAIACSDSSAPAPLVIPPFVYVADANGFANLVRFRNDTSTPLTSGSNNTNPNSRASRIVFTSDRDGYPQVYIADLDVTTPHWVMNSSAIDRNPSLSPAADSIAFVSTRSGAPRIWVISAPALDQVGYDTPVALATGSNTQYPEDAPAWSPTGGRIAFTSTSSGVSQVYVVASGGGTATAVTNEVGGAFSPAWSADGTKIYYVAATPLLILRWVNAVGGLPMTLVSDPQGVNGPASCDAPLCLFSTDPGGTSGSMCARSLTSSHVQQVFARTAAQEREPAILAP